MKSPENPVFQGLILRIFKNLIIIKYAKQVCFIGCFALLEIISGLFYK